VTTQTKAKIPVEGTSGFYVSERRFEGEAMLVSGSSEGYARGERIVLKLTANSEEAYREHLKEASLRDLQNCIPAMLTLFGGLVSRMTYDLVSAQFNGHLRIEGDKDQITLSMPYNMELLFTMY
jgi:hypothetical protein